MQIKGILMKRKISLLPREIQMLKVMFHQQNDSLYPWVGKKYLRKFVMHSSRRTDFLAISIRKLFDQGLVNIRYDHPIAMGSQVVGLTVKGSGLAACIVEEGL